MADVETKALSWPYKKPFKIASALYDTVDFVDVTISSNGHHGRGEGIGIPFQGETPETMLSDIAQVETDLKWGATRDDIQHLMTNGGARNAIDCALWDLECKQAETTIWDRLQITPKPLTTVCTIGIDHIEQMAADAKTAASSILKIKVSGEAALDQVKAVRHARPDARLIVDANRSLGQVDLPPLLIELDKLGVEMLEQPVEMGQDHVLDGLSSPIPLCADESCLTVPDLNRIEPYYDMVNIKLDKTGGLTHALELADEALSRNLALMVGCMAGTSLSMAPAFVVGQFCRYVDIDGPLLMKQDRDAAMTYDDGIVGAPQPELWG